MTVSGSWTLDALVEAYQQHQRRTRGLRDPTLLGYARFVRLLIRAAMGDDLIDLRRLGPSDVIQFVSAMTGRFSPRSMRTVGTALRSFFRFLRAEGVCDERLEAAIPAVAHWRLATLPRCLSDEQLAQLLASVDASTPCARRDRAHRALPRDPGAPARRGRRPASRRHRLAPWHRPPADAQDTARRRSSASARRRPRDRQLPAPRAPDDG